MAGDLGDLHVYDLVTAAWTDLTSLVNGDVPTPRYSQGFTSIGEKIYLFGGWDGGRPASDDKFWEILSHGD